MSPVSGHKELREAMYWLQLTQEAAIMRDRELDALVKEADELISILTSSIKAAKRREQERLFFE